MATPFSDLYAYIRAILQDTDSSYYRWENAVIDDALSLALLRNGDYSKSGSTVTPTLADDDDTALLVFETAKILITPAPGRFSFKTRVLSVSRDAAWKRDTLLLIEENLEKLKNGEALFTKDSSLIAYLECAQRTIDTINEADLS